jgi:flavodoxin
MKFLVVYYSKTGSNKYLAEKVAHTLKSDIQAIEPRLNFLPFLILFSLIKTGMGVKALKHNLNEYDRIVLYGPIWMGQFIYPLRDFIQKYGKSINRLYFASCCGSGDADKDGKFGHGQVFRQVKAMMGNKYVLCEAFPIGLVVPEDKIKDGNAIMKTRLSDNNFTGEIQRRFEDFIQRVSE